MSDMPSLGPARGPGTDPNLVMNDEPSENEEIDRQLKEVKTTEEKLRRAKQDKQIKEMQDADSVGASLLKKQVQTPAGIRGCITVVARSNHIQQAQRPVQPTG